MAATATTRTTVKPVKGRLVVISRAHTRTPSYSSLSPPVSIPKDSLDGKTGYVYLTGDGYAVVRLADQGDVTLSVKDTAFYRASRAEKNAWREEALDKMRNLPWGAGKEHYHGNDPELFAVDEAGVVIPAFAFLPSKEEAKEEEAWPDAESLYRSRGNFRLTRKMFYDGFQAEFTSPPSLCFAWAADYIQNGIQSLHNRVREFNKKANVTWKPVLDVTREMLDTSPEHCVALGCDPSKNAYFDGANPMLANLDASRLDFRFAGYHIHFGIGNKDPEEYIKIVKQCDAIAGVISVLVFRGMEDIRRRKYYGLAGEYRTPPHGLEWRTLSSCVLCSPYTFHLMSDLSRMACQLHLHRLGHLWSADEGEVQKAINELDVDLATKIMKDNFKALKLILRSIYPVGRLGLDPVKSALTLIEKGAKETVDINMPTSWHLNDNWRSHSNDSLSTIYGLKL